MALQIRFWIEKKDYPDIWNITKVLMNVSRSEPCRLVEHGICRGRWCRTRLAKTLETPKLQVVNFSDIHSYLGVIYIYGMLVRAQIFVWNTTILIGFDRVVDSGLAPKSWKNGWSSWQRTVGWRVMERIPVSHDKMLKAQFRTWGSQNSIEACLLSPFWREVLRFFLEFTWKFGAPKKEATTLPRTTLGQ